MRLVPTNSLRVAMLAFISAVAVLEVAAGVVLSEAWRQSEGGEGALHLSELDDMLVRLHTLQTSVVFGAAGVTMLWAFAAVDNAIRVGRANRAAGLAVASWVLAPLAIVLIDRMNTDSLPAALGMVWIVVQAIVLYLPFMTMGQVSARVGGPRAPFVRWYLAVLVSFVVHRAFIAATESVFVDTSELGRVASLSLVNAIAIGVVVVLASDASKALQHAISERAFERDQLMHDAEIRFRAGDVSSTRPA